MRHFDLKNVPNGGGQGKGDWATQDRGRAGGGIDGAAGSEQRAGIDGKPAACGKGGPRGGKEGGATRHGGTPEQPED